MDNRIDLIMSSVQQFCREGYLLPKERKTLFDLAELHGIDRNELEEVLSKELEKVRVSRLENLYKAAKQPDAALSDKLEMFQQSRRQFPDMLKLGTLKLKVNPTVNAPAFVPLKETTGFCLLHDNQAEMACNVIQNVTMRLLLSIPRSLAQITIVDPVSMGADFIGLSGIDHHLLKVIDDEKQIQPFLQTMSRDLASFNFNELGNSFADIAEYNRTNRSKARPYQIIILSDYASVLDKNVLSEFKKVLKLAQKAGVFFLFAIEKQQLDDMPDMLDVFKQHQDEFPSLCVVDTVKKQVLAGQSEEVSFFNNAFDFALDEDLMFSSDTIFQFNHEYDPEKYPIGKKDDDHGDFCIESLNVTAGTVFKKDKAYSVSLQQSHDNIISVSKDVNVLEAMAIGMLKGMTQSYKHSELDYVFYNCGFISEDMTAANIIANIHSQKLQYMQTLLKHVGAMVEERKNLLANFNVSNYEAYRNATGETLPRVICMFGGIETLLDSENLSAIDSVMLLDQLLDEAGQYGIHFLLFGTPTLNLFKLNMAEHIRYKLISSLDEEEAMRVGISPTMDELNHQHQADSSILFDANQSASVKLEVVATDSEKQKGIASTFVPEEGALVKPKVFVDVDDSYPQAYRSCNADTLADSCFNMGIPVGIMRCYSEQFLTLNHENVLIAGDDDEGTMSILRSTFVALNRAGRQSAMSVFDASGNYLLGMPGMPGVKVCSDLDMLPVAENGVVCLLNVEVADADFVNKVYLLLGKAQQKHACVLLFVKDATVLCDLGIVSAFFSMRIALCNAPENFISPVSFVMNDELSMPDVPMQALCERNDVLNNMEINAMWLFNY